MRAASALPKPPVFSRLMRRMESEVYVAGEYRNLRLGDRVVRQRWYAVTDFGLMQWKAARRFYAELAGPADDLVPVATEKGELAHFPPRTRKAIIRRRLARQFPELFPPRR